MMMKKFIALVLCIQLLNLPVLSQELINDSLVEQTLANKNLTVKTYNQQAIRDDVILPVKKSETAIGANAPIIDEFALKNIPAGKYKLTTIQQAPIQDELVSTNFKTTMSIKSKKKVAYDFTDIKKTPVRISIISNITTREGLKEGQSVEFRVLEDTNINPLLSIKKDSILTARIETISPNQAFGVPADLVIDNFTLKQPRKEETAFEGSIKKVGANRSLWVYPVGYAGLCFCFVGLLVFPIRGGHAKVKTEEVFEVYYVPNI